jgi:hypothetical protein
MDMTKFEGGDDPGFVAITGELRRWCRELSSANTRARAQAIGQQGQLVRQNSRSQDQTTARFWLPYVQTVDPMSRQSKLWLLSSGETISCTGTIFQLSMRCVTPQIDSPVILIQSSMPSLTLY